MDAILEVAKKHDWSSGSFHREYFAAPQIDSSAGSFDVMLKSTSEAYRTPDNKSVVEVIAEHGIEIPVSCEQGACGTCLTTVFE